MERGKKGMEGGKRREVRKRNEKKKKAKSHIA